MIEQEKISTTELMRDANDLMIHDLVVRYLPRRFHKNRWQLGDVLITATGPFERTGIPADATCWRYVIEESELGWCFIVRAVWDRDGQLLKPLATHAVIEKYEALEDFWFPSENDIIYAVNCWLRTT